MEAVLAEEAAISCLRCEDGRKRSPSRWTFSCKLFTEMTPPRRLVRSGEKLRVMIVISSLLGWLAGEHLFLRPGLGRVQRAVCRAADAQLKLAGHEKRG